MNTMPMASWAKAGDDVKDNRELQKLFDEMMPKWIAGKLQAPGLETWRAFRERVQRGFRGILEADRRSRRVVVFTSGGPIGVAVQTVVGRRGTDGDGAELADSKLLTHRIHLHARPRVRWTSSMRRRTSRKLRFGELLH